MKQGVSYSQLSLAVSDMILQLQDKCSRGPLCPRGGSGLGLVHKVILLVPDPRICPYYKDLYPKQMSALLR